MEILDIFLLIIVYLYVIIVFTISEKLLKNKESVKRKFVHIMVGNMIFLMPAFSDPMIMVYYLTLPITIGAFLISEYSPLKIDNSISKAGHGLGLVYYAGVWTLLLFIFNQNLLLVGLSMAPMVYGDGVASIIGEKYGKHKFTFIKDTKSIEGSFSMFITTFLVSIFIWIFFSFLNYPLEGLNLTIILIISLIATITEAISYKGLDNLLVPIVSAILYYFVML